jgi:hypothetical protein
MPRPHPFGAAMAFADRRVGGAPEKADFNRPAQSRHTNNNSPNQARPAYHLCYRNVNHYCYITGVTQSRLDWFVGQGFPACLDSLERPSHTVSIPAGNQVRKSCTLLHSLDCGRNCQVFVSLKGHNVRLL